MSTGQQRRGLGLMRLVATDGHSHWAEPRLDSYVVGGYLYGYTLSIPCELGGVRMIHYIGRDATTGQACWQSTPYAFTSIADAEVARDELAARQQPNEGE